MDTQLPVNTPSKDLEQPKQANSRSGLIPHFATVVDPNQEKPWTENQSWMGVEDPTNFLNFPGFSEAYGEMKEYTQPTGYAYTCALNRYNPRILVWTAFQTKFVDEVNGLYDVLLLNVTLPDYDKQYNSYVIWRMKVTLEQCRDDEDLRHSLVRLTETIRKDPNPVWFTDPVNDTFDRGPLRRHLDTSTLSSRYADNRDLEVKSTLSKDEDALISILTTGLSRSIQRVYGDVSTQPGEEQSPEKGHSSVNRRQSSERVRPGLFDFLKRQSHNR